MVVMVIVVVVVLLRGGDPRNRQTCEYQRSGSQAARSAKTRFLMRHEVPKRVRDAGDVRRRLAVLSFGDEVEDL